MFVPLLTLFLSNWLLHLLLETLGLLFFLVLYELLILLDPLKVLFQALFKLCSYFWERLFRECDVLSFRIVMEKSHRGLNRVEKGYRELIDHDGPCRCLFCLWNAITASKISEKLKVFWEYLGKDSWAIIVRISNGIVWTKEKYVFLFRMTMEVKVNLYLVVLLNLVDQPFDGDNLWI